MPLGLGEQRCFVDGVALAHAHDGHHFGESGGCRIGDREIDDGLSLRTDRCELLEAAVPTADTGGDPLHVPEDDDGLSVTVIRGLAASIEHQRADVVIVTALVGLWEIRQLGLADRLERQPLQHFQLST